ncbi:MAG: acetate--CoA ligase family protein [Planctomycetia bacterium]|nr:acetate--CoA ligase family protein [Planctomycetia bacterium]
MSKQERLAKINSMFYPKSIAVVGASAREGSVGNDLLKNLVNGFTGKIFPVNPKGGEILGVKAYASLLDIPEEVDLVLISVPAKGVTGVVDQCAAKKAKGIVVISAGFKEAGHEGAEREKALAQQVLDAGIPLIGPNCLGIINSENGIQMNASFASKTCAPGSLAFVSQSGALCTSVLDFAEARQMGFSKFVSFGNKADVKEVDLLEYLADDPKTTAIAMYLEDISDGKRFAEIASKIFWEKGKPVICLKSGRSAEGAKAVSSHTGSLAGSDRVYDALLTQSGVQRVNSIEELFDNASLYITQPLPKGNRIAIITNAGGPGIMATDAAVKAGLKLAQLEESTKEALRAKLSEAASVRNPVDVLGDARSDKYEAAVQIIMKDPNVDMGLVILTPQSMTDTDNIGAVIPNAVKGTGKPCVCAFMGAASVQKGVNTLVANGVPNYSFPENAINALASSLKLVEMKDLQNREMAALADCDVEKAKKVINDFLGSDKEKYLTQADCRALFECYKLPLLASGIAHSADEASKIVAGIGAKVVMKVMSADVVHKFDAGGVILNVDGSDAAKAAYDKIYANIAKSVPGAKIDGILIEQMAEKGVEVILGCNRDDKFGPLMMFGLGGTLVELLKDVSFRLAPMWKTSADRMVREIKAFKVLDGYRGAPKCDIAAVQETLLRLSTMVCNHPEIAECDINPLIVHAEGKGCSVADSRVMLRRK